MVEVIPYGGLMLDAATGRNMADTDSEEESQMAGDAHWCLICH